jgi:glycosyltransferase involved in cell wall biosynthesis
MSATKECVTFLFPVYNDFDSLRVVLENISNSIAERSEAISFDFLVVDDCSPRKDKSIANELLQNYRNLTILETRMRSGHQKAILLGLAHLDKIKSSNHVVILDSDGEDRPTDALALAEMLVFIGTQEIIQVQRGVRYSSYPFKVSYFFYRQFFRLLVGKKNPPGNFMAIPNYQIMNVISFPGVDKHIAASIMRYASSNQSIKFDRGRRLTGSSKMNFSSLFVHAYGSLSVFADVVFARIVVGISLILAVLTLLGSILFGLKIMNLIPAIPGWTSILLLLIFSSVLIVGTNIVLLMLLMVKLEK